MIEIDLNNLDSTKFRLTLEGLEIVGSAEALKKSRELYPTEADLLRQNTEFWKMLNAIKKIYRRDERKLQIAKKYFMKKALKALSKNTNIKVKEKKYKVKLRRDI